jgi:hypothetical protein
MYGQTLFRWTAERDVAVVVQAIGIVLAQTVSVPDAASCSTGAAMLSRSSADLGGGDVTIISGAAAGAGAGLGLTADKEFEVGAGASVLGGVGSWSLTEETAAEEDEGPSDVVLDEDR